MFSLNAKILIVDDASIVRRVLSNMCAEFGLKNLTAATDGADAWEKISNANPPFELIICDWNMPNLSGFDLIEKARKDSRFEKLPFLMVTSESRPAQMEKAFKMGVDDYIAKPFNREMLLEKLEAIHKKHKI